MDDHPDVPKPAGSHTDTLVHLSSRLVYSLLKGAVSVAARFEMPLERLVELARLAFFEEQGRRPPRDLKEIARRLGVSLRTVGNLSKQLKGQFFAPEMEIEPLRRITAILVDGERSFEEIRDAAGNLSEKSLNAALVLLVETGWVEHDDGVYTLKSAVRSYVGEDLVRRIDGLNNLMDIVSQAVWQKFVQQKNESTGARSWVLAANPDEFSAFMEQSIHSLRHGLIDLEEKAIADGRFGRFGITVSFTPMERDNED